MNVNELMNRFIKFSRWKDIEMDELFISLMKYQLTIRMVNESDQ